MREANKIIERYVINPTKIQVMDETRLYFKVLSMSKEDTCCNVYFQCSFCVCLDYKCKHLMGIRLLIEQHMPKSQKELHFIDDVLEMHGLQNLVSVNANFDGDKDESIFATISILKETFSTCQVALDSITTDNVSICKEKMQVLYHELTCMLFPLR